MLMALSCLWLKSGASNLLNNLRMSVSTGVLVRVPVVRVSVSLMKHRDQKQVGEERLYQLTLPHYCASPKEVRTGTQTRQELMQRPRRGAAY